MRSYLVKHAPGPVTFREGFDGEVWRCAVTQKLEEILPEASNHRPDVRVRMLYDEESIWACFKVADRYVRAASRADQEQVCRDSCVEVFLRPAGAEKYFNFEMNCGGIMLLYHIRSFQKQDYTVLPHEELRQIERYHTLPERVEPEIADPVEWQAGFRIPLAFFVRHAGIEPRLSGQVWHGNFSKCADFCSHPHWLTWMPFSEFSFHLPSEFGEIRFE